MIRRLVAALALAGCVAEGAERPAPTAAPAAAPVTRAALPSAMQRVARRLGIDGTIVELIQDARIDLRIQPQLRRQYWFGEGAGPQVESIMRAAPLQDAWLRLTDAGGRTLDSRPLDSPFADLALLDIDGPLLLVTESRAGFGLPAGEFSTLLVAETGRLIPVEARDSGGGVQSVQLVRAMKTDWRLAGDGRIHQLVCRPESGDDGFAEVYVTYSRDPDGWRRREIVRRGWCDWPTAFPEAAFFP